VHFHLHATDGVPLLSTEIRWQLTLHAGDVAGSRGTYMLVTIHGMSETIRLFKADVNIMFFVGQDGRLMVGNAGFSYTLNRADEKFSGE
jgi:hypothetical protein